MIHFSHYISGSGTFPPPGHWNDIACDLIIEHNLDELESARTLAVLNIALMDAGISCWDTNTITVASPLVGRSGDLHAYRQAAFSFLYPGACNLFRCSFDGPGLHISLPKKIASCPWPMKRHSRASKEEFITDSITTKVSNLAG